MKEYIQVITSTRNKKDAEKIAAELIRMKLAACTQILGPVNSFYWWNGNIETANEWICVIKSKRSLYSQIERVIKKLHPYQVPEILALPVVEGSKDYLKWFDNEIQQA